MARVTSIVGRYAGVVSYTDGSNGSWHCQMECDDISDLYWSIDQAYSQLHTANVDFSNSSEFAATWMGVISHLPFITTFTWGSSPHDDRIVSDVVHSLSLLMTLDDGTKYPVSVTYEKGERRDHLNDTDLPSAPDNAAEIIAKLQTMLEMVSDTGQPVMA